ncbi:hypothetical protein N869_12065, partial [Cellulomonas bogoriensis 69B4 = DSM 16987]
MTTSATVAGVCTQCRAPLPRSSPFCTRCGALAGDPTGDPAGAQARGTTAQASPGLPVVPAHDPALGPAFDGATVGANGRRVLAYLVDAALVATVVALTHVLAPHWVYAAVLGVEAVVALVLVEARTGRTPGHTLTGLRVSRVETPYAPGLGRASSRALVLGAGHALGVGQLLVLASPALDRSGLRQGWHDVVGRTVVLDVRALRARRA